MSGNDTNFLKMTKTPVPRLVTSLAVPTVISMLITSVYNTADAYFVSKLGTSATGAVGVVSSLMSVIQAVGFAIGMGSGSIIAKGLGEKKNESASEISASGIVLGAVIGVILAFFSYLYLTELMILLGSTKTILPYAKSYAGYIILGMPFMILSFVMNNILRSEGKAKYAMIGIGVGGLLNIAIDPLFIFTFKMGTEGAALATFISQVAGFLILGWFFLSGRTVSGFHISKISRKFKVYISILKMGMPSLIRQGLASTAAILLNRSARVYGDASLAAIGVVLKIFMIIYAVLLGIGQGFQPVVGTNYGAKEYKRVKKAIYFTVCLGIAVMVILVLPTILFSDKLINLFTKGDPEVIKIGKKALVAYCIALPAIPVSMVCNMTFQMTAKPLAATILAAARQGIFFIPLISILPNFFGLSGIIWTQCVSDFATFLFSLPFLIFFLKKLKIEEGKQRKT